MSEWIESPLDHLAEITSGGTPSRSNDVFWNGDIPWVTPSDITKCKTNYLHDTQDSITRKGLMSSSAKMLPSGALLFTSRATIGEVKIAERAVATNQGFKNLVPKNVIDGVFLFYQLSRLKKEFFKYAAGSTFLEINRKDTGRVLVPHPAQLVAQKKVAKILQTIDQTLEKTEALIEKYQQIKAGLMHDLFTRGIGADGQLRPPREQAPELYQKTQIGWIPKEWNLRPLTSIASYQHGRPFPSADYSIEGTLLLRPGNLHVSGYVVFDEAHRTRIPQTWERVAPTYIVEKNDILMNLTAQSLDDEFLGRVCLHENTERALLNQRIARFKALTVEHIFLYWILRSRQFRKQIDRTSQGTKVQHLYNRDIDRVRLGVPVDENEQKLIALILNNISKKMRIEEDFLHKLKQRKSGLMHDLLTGKKQVTIDQPETAHV